MHERNIYEDLDIETDILFFKLGCYGLVSFHGSHYNIKRKLAAEQIRLLCFSGLFFPASSVCYINMGKISAIEEGTVYFGSKLPKAKRIQLSRWKACLLRSRISGLRSRRAVH